MAIPDTGCKETTIPLLQNKEALCWFDSGNFALFHKRRPELDAKFVPLEGATLNTTQLLIKEVYDHFSGTTIITDPANLQGLIKRFRESSELQAIFNSKVGENFYRVTKIFTKKSSASDGNTEEDIQIDIQFEENKQFEIKKNKVSSNYEVERVIGDITYTVNLTEDEFNNNFEKITKGAFSLNTGETNDVIDYIKGYLNQKLFDTLRGKKATDIVTAFLSDIQKNEIKITDIINESLQITENTHTIFVDTGYDKIQKSNQNYPEVLTIPLLGDDNKYKSNISFTLDAIVVHTGGVHYFVLVRCGNTHDWVIYDDTQVKTGDTLALQNKQQIFSSFPATYKGIPYDINQTAKLLIYSRFDLPPKVYTDP